VSAELRGALHFQRDADGALCAEATLRHAPRAGCDAAGLVADGPSLALRSPLGKWAPRLALRVPLPRCDAGALTAWVAQARACAACDRAMQISESPANADADTARRCLPHARARALRCIHQGGGAGGSLALSARHGSVSACATLEALPSSDGALVATLRADGDVSRAHALLRGTRAGAEWRTSEQHAARLHVRHTRPEGTPGAGCFAALEVRVARGEPLFRREGASLILGRRFDFAPSEEPPPPPPPQHEHEHVGAAGAPHAAG
jgi:hypothetical protein